MGKVKLENNFKDQMYLFNYFFCSRKTVTKDYQLEPIVICPLVPNESFEQLLEIKPLTSMFRLEFYVYILTWITDRIFKLLDIVNTFIGTIGNI